MKYQIELNGSGRMKVFRGPLGCRFDADGTEGLTYIYHQFDSDEQAIEFLPRLLKNQEATPDAVLDRAKYKSRS